MIKWDKHRICDSCEKTNADYDGSIYTLTFEKTGHKIRLCEDCFINMRNFANNIKTEREIIEAKQTEQKGTEENNTYYCDDFSCSYAGTELCVAEDCNVCKLHNCRGCRHLKECIEEYNNKITRGDMIRSFNDKELARFLINFKNEFGEEYEGEKSCEDWLKEYK